MRRGAPCGLPFHVAAAVSLRPQRPVLAPKPADRDQREDLQSGQPQMDTIHRFTMSPAGRSGEFRFQGELRPVLLMPNRAAKRQAGDSVLANPAVSAFFRGPDQGQTGQVGGTEKNKKMSESTNINLADFKIHDTDTGSADYQVALMTQRIVHLTAHLQLHKKDTSSRRGLLKLVAQRRKLLDYVRANSEERYQKLLAGLSLRK